MSVKRPLTDVELIELEDLGAQADRLTKRRTELRSDHLNLKVVASGLGTPIGHRVFASIMSLGAQLQSVERRIDRLLDRSAPA